MDLTQLISDKESELSRLRHAAADATRKQQDESKEQMLRIIKSMEDEMQDMHREHERTLQNVIEKVQNEAAAEMERLRKEAEEAMKNFEEETIKSALYDVERHRASMQESLREQYESSLQMELERQRDQIFAECERVLQEKEDELKQSELDMKRHIETLQRQHRMELESTEHRIEALSNEVRNSVRQDSFIEAEERISKVILDAEKQCQLRDEQISLLLEERDLLQRELKDKELELKESMNDLVDLDHVFVDVAKEIKTRHQKEIMRLSEEGLVAVQQKEKLQEAIRSIESDNASLNNELVQLRLKYKAMKFKRFEQEEVNSAFGRRKNESANHIVDIHSCNQMLERQVGDLKLEKHSLTQVICELKMEIKQQAIKATNLSTTIEELRESNNTLQNDCFDMKRKCMEANERAESLQQEKRRYEQEMEHRLRQKDLQLTDALWAAGEKLNKKNEPVVVHLHGNNCDSQKSSSNDATNECNLLRSRLLEVQRENYRLEIELMEAKRECRSNVELPNINNQGDSACQKLYEENNSLKQIVTMMRKDIEHFTNSLETSNHEPGNLIASESYSFSLEQQLVQCRAYLDVLLKVRCANRGGLHVLRADDDECHFLRLRYKELHDVLDQVRAENLRLRQGSESRKYDDRTSPTLREQQLILNLEEASDEIEALIEQRDKLLSLSNRLKNELKWMKEQQHYHSSTSSQFHVDSIDHDNADVVKNDKNLMNAILNDLSRSFDAENQAASSNDNAIVACFGTKPPLLRSSSLRPSKNAHVSQPISNATVANYTERLRARGLPFRFAVLQ